MAKLSDVGTAEHKKLLVCGPPGSGKTCFAASFPYPTMYLDFDGKVDSAAAWFAADGERLNGIDVRDMSAKLGDVDPIQEMQKIIKNELIPQQQAGKSQYKTLVIDSVTTFSTAVLQHIMKTNPGIKRPQHAQGTQPCPTDYGILKREFMRLIPGLLSLPMHIIMLGHLKADKDELTGEIIRGPMMDGSFAQELPIYFKEVYRSFMRDGKPYAQTQSDLYFTFCRSQIPGLPSTVEMKYENLVKKWK